PESDRRCSAIGHLSHYDQSHACAAARFSPTSLAPEWSSGRIILHYAISRASEEPEMSGQVVRLRQAKIVRNATSRLGGRRGDDGYRVREHLTDGEIDKLLGALKRNRHGHRDWLIGLIIYRHGLRVSEACDLRWDEIDLRKRTLIVRRLKGSTDSVHYLERENALKLLHRQQQANGIKAAYVFINE